MMPATSTQLQPKSLSILGATGSIGENTLKLIANNRDAYYVEALTAQNNVEQLAQLAKNYRARVAVIGNEAHYQALKTALSGTGIEVAAGAKALAEAASRKVDWVMAAIVGAAGLLPTLAAIKQGATVALANKECLVCAGHLMLEQCKKYGATLLPVDSEHNAIFQVFDFEQREQIEKVTLTASGGPLRTRSLETLKDVTPQEAIAHPNWKMGEKISVDSATMMNKALEMVEAHYLFALAPEQIKAIIHPESIIHSMVHYRDGSVLAQMGVPDMQIPIAYTLAWPARMAQPTPKLDLAKIGALHFEVPDEQRYPAMRLIRDVLAEPERLACVMNAANEVAVQRFLDGTCGYTDIVPMVEKAVGKAAAHTPTSIDEVLTLDAETRRVMEHA